MNGKMQSSLTTIASKSDEVVTHEECSTGTPCVKQRMQSLLDFVISTLSSVENRSVVR